MHPRIQELLDFIDVRRIELRRAVDAVPESVRETPPGPTRWSVAQVIEHLGVIEGRVAMLFSTRLAEAREQGLGPELDTSPVVAMVDVDRLLDRRYVIEAPETAQPRARLSSEAAWAALEQSRVALRAAIREGNGLALGDVSHPHPVFGPSTLYQWGIFVGAHEARHTAQIREIGAALT
jgi:hypothetical protein